MLALAIAHILSLTSALNNSPIINASHVLTVLRSTHDALNNAAPLDMTHAISVGPGVYPGSAGGRPLTTSSTASTRSGSLLSEVVAGGVGLGKEVLGAEPGRELWKRLVG